MAIEYAFMDLTGRVPSISLRSAFGHGVGMKSYRLWLALWPRLSPSCISHESICSKTISYSALHAFQKPSMGSNVGLRGRGNLRLSVAFLSNADQKSPLLRQTVPSISHQLVIHERS